jgi:hypothetical protein
MYRSDKANAALRLLKGTKLSDGDVGEIVGLSRARVQQIRKQHKIAPIVQGVPANAANVLGKVYDKKAAIYFNVTKVTIIRWRKKLGIPALNKTEVVPKPKCEWTILSKPFYIKKHKYVTARCKCGVSKSILVNALRQGTTNCCRNCYLEGARKK